MQGESRESPITGDDLVRVLAALANAHRLRIVAALVRGRVHVSQLARDVGLSRPLVQVHLRRLEVAGLVAATLELSPDGKAMKFYDVTPFALTLTPQTLAEAAESLSAGSPKEEDE